MSDFVLNESSQVLIAYYVCLHFVGPSEEPNYDMMTSLFIVDTDYSRFILRMSGMRDTSSDHLRFILQFSASTSKRRQVQI